MLIINCLESLSLKNITPAIEENIIVPPVINGYKTDAGSLIAEIS